MQPTRLATKSNPADELAQIVSQAHQCAKELLSILDREREALGSGQVRDIDSCGQQKADCVIELERLDQERAALCTALNIADTDIDKFISSESTLSPLVSWNRFLISLEQCRDANAINGKLTALRRRHVEQALLVLSGGLQNDAGLYGPNGLDRNKSASSLGQA